MTTNRTKKSIYISTDDMKTWQDLTENAKKSNMGTGVFICFTWDDKNDKKYQKCRYCNLLHQCEIHIQEYNEHKKVISNICENFTFSMIKKYGPKNIEFTDINTKTFHIPVAMADTWEEIEKAAKVARRGVGFFICEKWVEWNK